MIIVFLVDTSASMNQKFSNGMSALECTKSGIEHLVKVTCAARPQSRIILDTTTLRVLTTTTFTVLVLVCL